jgi:hypothetical protein
MGWLNILLVNILRNHELINIIIHLSTLKKRGPILNITFLNPSNLLNING